MNTISLSINGKIIETTPNEHLYRCLEEAQTYASWANSEADDEAYKSLNESEVNQLLSYISEIQSSIQSIEDSLEYRLSEIEEEEEKEEEEEEFDEIHENDESDHICNSCIDKTIHEVSSQIMDLENIDWNDFGFTLQILSENDISNEEECKSKIIELRNDLKQYCNLYA